MKKNNDLENSNRIVYIDPNDVRGNINGAPLTPDYTEFSIWCNLIIEKTTRLKNQDTVDSEDRIYQATFDLTRAENGTEYVSFLQGKDAENYNFLTTDYTNIDFEEIRRRNIIEGLQIESVNVGFTNYQTPQVTIKFVDIRGGGFFGREEATHNEYGQLYNLEEDRRNKQMDNFFGCFVTFPYPRFRLQIKGFYGRPVTFQLTCTSFVGNFNATTGNFEITVQFIGYEYGVLGDIPFDLLVAAPLTKTGADYWDSQIRDLENSKWYLDKEKTEAPYKLFDFYQNVSKELNALDSKELDDMVVDTSLENEMIGVKEQVKLLNEIKEDIGKFKESVKNIFKPYYITETVNDTENVIVIHNPSEIMEVSSTDRNFKDMCDKYNKLSRAVTEYNNFYSVDNGGISTSIIPNITNDGKWIDWVPKNINFSHFITHNTKVNNSQNKSDHKNVINSTRLTLDGPTSCVGVTIKKLYSKEEYKISTGVSKSLYEHINTQNWGIYGNEFNRGIAFAGYAVVIDFGNTKKEIDDKISELTTRYENYKTKINSIDNKSIKDIVGFTPFVGRYFKVVMCHLETFVHLFNNCADGIYDQINGKIERKASKLGIRDLKNETDVPTDISSNDPDVPPFPAVYKKYTTREEDEEILNSGQNIVANAWLGDFKGVTNWLEVKLVEELFLAAQRIAASREQMKDSEIEPYTTINYDSLMPIDFFNAIPTYAYTSKDGAMFYAALRAEVALNFMQSGQAVDNKVAEQLGMFDAYMFAKTCPSELFLKDLADTTSLSKDIYNTTVCNGTFKSSAHFLYEFAKVFQDRHPVFIENNGYVKYNYMTNKDNHTEFIPLDNFGTFSKNSGFSTNYVYNNGNDFNPVNVENDDFLVGNNEAEDTSYEQYTNTHHFNVITNSEAIEKIKSNYTDFRNGKLNIGNKKSSELNDSIGRHVLISNERTESFREQVPMTNYKSYNSLGINFDEQNKGLAFINNFLNKVTL